MWGFEHVESKCGQVSMALLEHNVQFGFGCKVGQKIIFVVIAHVLGVLESQIMCDLSVCDYGVFPNLVGEFVVDLVVGCPFIYICEFGLSQS